MVSYSAFTDELMKIAAGAVSRIAGKALEHAARSPGKAMLLAGGGTLLGVDQLKKLKRRYSIGSQVEKQQRAAARMARRRR